MLASLTLVGSTVSPAAPTPAVSTQKLLGQRIMVSMAGTAPSTSLLRNVQAGRVGGVILYAYNVGTPTQVKSLTSALQRAARRGHNPPLLIAIDQEGGEVKRLPG